MTQFILDISQYQGAVDFAKVRASGISGVVARCIMENDGLDPDYAGNIAGIRAMGMVPGAYAFLSGGMAAAQAAAFIRAVGDPRGMLIMLDVERPGFHPTPTAADVGIFAKAWYAKWPTHRLHIYGSPGGPLGSLGNLSAYGDLWIADYVTSTTGSPAAIYSADGGEVSRVWGMRLWTTPTFWQFTSDASVPGIAGRVDCSAYRGTLSSVTGLTLPDTSTGGTMGLSVHIAATTNAASPWTSFATAKVSGAGHSAMKVSDATRMAVADGLDLGVVQFATLTAPLDTAAGDRTNGIITNIAGEEYFLLKTDVALTPIKPPAPPVPAPTADTTPFAQADIDSAVARQKAADMSAQDAAVAAVASSTAAPLRTTIATQTAVIADLRTQLAGANIATNMQAAKVTALQRQLDKASQPQVSLFDMLRKFFSGN